MNIYFISFVVILCTQISGNYNNKPDYLYKNLNSLRIDENRYKTCRMYNNCKNVEMLKIGLVSYCSILTEILCHDILAYVYTGSQLTDMLISYMENHGYSTNKNTFNKIHHTSNFTKEKLIQIHQMVDLYRDYHSPATPEMIYNGLKDIFKKEEFPNTSTKKVIVKITTTEYQFPIQTTTTQVYHDHYQETTTDTPETKIIRHLLMIFTIVTCCFFLYYSIVLCGYKFFSKQDSLRSRSRRASSRHRHQNTVIVDVSPPRMHVENATAAYLLLLDEECVPPHATLSTDDDPPPSYDDVMRADGRGTCSTSPGWQPVDEEPPPSYPYCVQQDVVRGGPRRYDNITPVASCVTPIVDRLLSM